MADGDQRVAWVANQFVSMYSEVLRQHPHSIHKFYQEGSSLLVVHPNGDQFSGNDLATIQAVVDAHCGGGEGHVAVQHAQSTIGGGVLIVCYGSMRLKGADNRYTQVFVLAPQENGYYVHNAILRLLPKEEAEPVRPLTPPRTAQNGATPVSKAVAPPAQAAPTPAAAAVAAPPEATSKESNGPAVPAPTATPSSWAAVLKQKEQQKAAAAAAQSAAQPAAPTVQAAKDGEQAGAEAPKTSARPRSRAQSPAVEAPVHGVYVRNLPQTHLAVDALEAEFSKYGQLKARDTPPVNKQAVVIHNTAKDGKVAYILYQEPAGVDAVLKATVKIGDHVVEIRKLDADSGLSFYARGPASGRGGFSSSRGGASGRDGGRGGRGEGRGDRPPRSGGDRERERSERPPRTFAPGLSGRGAGGAGRGGRGTGRGPREEAAADA